MTGKTTENSLDALRDSDAAETPKSVRTSLVLRSAKIVCQSGEYVCLIRDVSELGASLTFFHETPPESRVILALANGSTVPIERIWTGRRQAGYRFGARVSLDEVLHDASPFAPRPIRLRLTATARVIDGRLSHTACLLDLSSRGAKFECEGVIKPKHLIGFQAEGMKQQLGKVVWCDGDAKPLRYGLQFQHPLELKELAAIALRAQPFDPKAQNKLGSLLKKASAA